MQDIQIAKAGSEDLPAILALQKLAFLSEAELYNDFTIEPLVQTPDSIAEDYTRYVFLKATCGNTLVGSVKGRETGEYCWIGRLIVDPVYQNRGIGKRLMKAIENEFPAANRYVLCTGQYSSKNISLYKSLGYTEQGFITDERNPGLKMVRMIRENNSRQAL